MKLLRILQQKISRTELLFLCIIFFISVAVRFYKLPQNLFFGFEQGRDAQIILDIYEKHEFKLVGPKTDLDGIFHGAYYYYLLLPAYVLSQGNPVAASFFLVVLSSFTSIIAYFFAKDFFGSQKSAMIIAVVTTMSYEYVIYARWLSNVTPAIPLILLTFWVLWLYHQHKKPWQFVSAVIFAALASQFEIVLVLLFGWVFICLWIFRIISFPNLKTLFISILAGVAIFVPHALFNLRNQNIVVNSIVGFLIGKGEKHQGTLNLLGNFHSLQESYTTSFRRALSLPHHPMLILLMKLVGVAGLVWSQRKATKTSRQKLTFLLVWLLMCVPVVLFRDVASLTQLYLGVGLAIIFLFVFAMQSLWNFSVQRHPLGKALVVFATVIVLIGWLGSLQKLDQNQDVFFVTIQIGMNYADQQRVLNYIHNDAQGQTYRFNAYTIPYLQPQGWEYLHGFLHPADDTNNGAKTVYTVIENQVEPFWIKKWNEDLGASTLITEQQFGLIRVEKRVLH